MSNRKDTSASWTMEGDYFEGCNCDSIYPCIFMADPDKGYCDATVAWHIQKGYYENTQLDGLNAVAVFHAPGNMFTGPKMKMAVYIDEKANSAQGEALKKILSGQAGGFFSAVANLIGENMGIRSVPIEFHTEGRRRWLSIPKLLELQIEGVAGGDKNRESVIVNPGFTVAPGFDPVIARSSKYTFNDYGMTWDNSNKNGFYSRFTYAP
jgi:hypothetical protein